MSLQIYNTLSRTKEIFRPIHEGRVGMYVCGPTVYGDAHLGHARPAVTFDLLFRYLQHTGYKVRYVRNITDVGHLEHDADEGEDKIEKKARLEQLEPMEVAQYYTNRFNTAMAQLNVLPPSIEPHATGHIIEQIELVKQILEAGYAYESNGSVYFDVVKYNEDYHYGILSGRNLEEVRDASRELDGVGEKRHQVDFALWKKAQDSHIMRWPSPWGEGFPGWHCECTAMGRKYLGEEFDIHGGGMDLMFPHHECEIAQSMASQHHAMVRYWMHNNMITIAGKKMGKSYNNFITLDQFFKGEHELLSQPFSPMTIRFFILQAHYRSTLDFSNDALVASQKGLERLMDGMANLGRIRPTEDSERCTAAEEKAAKEECTLDETGVVSQHWVDGLRQRCYDAMDDDLNSPILIAHLFEACRVINAVVDGKLIISAEALGALRDVFKTFVLDILGLNCEEGGNAHREEAFSGAVDLLLEVRAKAKANKDWTTSDQIRDQLAALGFAVKDTKDGATWKLEK